MSEPPPVEAPGVVPVYRIPLRVHVGSSTLRGDELFAVLSEINSVWLSQAGVCFEVETVLHDETMSEGFDLWFTSEPIPGDPGLNGIYRGSHDVWSLDYPSLGYAPTPITHPAARTAAHELGHGLALNHQNCGNSCPCEASEGLDCDDLLMTSGRLGFFLSGYEVGVARGRASSRALSDTAPTACNPPQVL
jgi:hypothetical protein